MDFKKRPYKRNDRLSKEIKIILSDFILKDFNLEGAGIITISKVNVSRDLSCLLYTSPSPRDRQKSRMPSSA